MLFREGRDERVSSLLACFRRVFPLTDRSVRWRVERGEERGWRMMYEFDVGCWKLFLNAEEWRSGGWRFCVVRGKGERGCVGKRECGSFTLASFIGEEIFLSHLYIVEVKIIGIFHLLWIYLIDLPKLYYAYFHGDLRRYGNERNIQGPVLLFSFKHGGGGENVIFFFIVYRFVWLISKLTFTDTF